MVGTRLAGIYVSPAGHLPGWDFNDYGLTAWRALSQGKTSVIFGYGTVLLAAVGLRYQSMVAGSLIGLFILLFLCIKEKRTRIAALFFFGIFLLGVPMSKAVEAGNPDLFLSVLFGIILLMLRNRTRTHSLISSILLGLLLGFFLNVKGFLLLFVLAALVVSGPDVAVIASFLVGFAAFSLWPWLYGVKSGIFDIFVFAVRGSQAESQTMFTQIHYGNNAILPYVSNVLQSFGAPRILIYIGSIMLALIIFVKPFVDEKIFLSVHHIKRSFSSFPFHLLIFTVCYIMMLTLTAWSYDYRILYALPLLFCFLGETRDRQTTRLLYLSIFFLLTKSLPIPKDRIMTAFLYLHFYFLLRAAISLLYNETHETHRHYPKSGAFRPGQNRHII
jgi:hypothetical protein